jgi:hypothetical protein
MAIANRFHLDCLEGMLLASSGMKADPRVPTPLTWGGRREDAMDDAFSLRQELEDFKRNIDLREFAAGLGYQLDRRASWRGSAVMRNASDDKIVIKIDGDGHFVYFSVRDPDDNGSVIDFLQKRSRKSIGHVRKELRAWLGRPRPAVPVYPKMPKTAKDRMAVEQAFQKMQPVQRHPYLENHRGIFPSLLASPRFAGRIRIDHHGNAVFPHFDRAGLCGFELKNREFTGFAPGGTKGLWFSHAEKSDNRLVFSESAIDALSYACLFPIETCRYASIGGQVNPEQPDLVKAAIIRMPEGSEIIGAMDNDADGTKLAAMIQNAALESGRRDLIYRRHSPSQPAKDWNDELRPTPSLFPTAQP